MEKLTIKQNIDACIEKNFFKFSDYFEINIQIFFEVKPLILEALTCLMLEYYFSTITLTNNIIERLLKLALIYNSTGIGPIPVHEWNNIFKKPNEDFGSLTFSKSIVMCNECGLIDDNEKDYLHEIIREFMRNGFSHADAKKILSHLPNESDLILSKISDLSNEKVTLNQKSIPPIQAILIHNFVEENAEPYLKFVMGLLLKIEERLIRKGTCT